MTRENPTIQRDARIRAMRRLVSSRRGVTLIEVMIVIAILVTLMGALGFALSRAAAGAKVSQTELTLRQIESEVMLYSVRKKGVPEGSDGLASIYGKDEVPKDGWGNDFIYVTPGPDGKDYDVISYGADGTEGGAGNDADLKLSELN
ncbi:MAG: prepilin-type N-terminal cleavage/methylation domain-containing protein [Deltaproteobacteria bacterium]|nr:MAG: prepilin-type N-terminal cleavage/methylation domain-containing protein [Deltaproteobacteria bacterium]